MAASAGSSGTKSTGAAGESISMGLSNRNCITNCSLDASPAAWGTRYSRYYIHKKNLKTYLKKQMQDSSGG